MGGGGRGNHLWKNELYIQKQGSEYSLMNLGTPVSCLKKKTTQRGEREGTELDAQVRKYSVNNLGGNNSRSYFWKCVRSAPFMYFQSELFMFFKSLSMKYLEIYLNDKKMVKKN